MYQSKFYDGFALNRAWIEIPVSITTGLVDTVRTRVLTFVLQIQSELPDEATEDIRSIPPAVVDRIVLVTIMGGNNVIGNVEQFSTQTIVAGDLASLKAALTGIGVNDAEFTELEESLEADGTGQIEGEKPKTLGKKTLEWIGNAAKKTGEAGAKIGGAVAEEAIKAALRKYLGLP
jgi:uncharacterized membrane protein